MDKESLILLQKIDCNCNDCKHLQRDIEKFKASQEAHHKWQFDYFTTIKNKLIQKAKWYKDRYYDLERWDALLTEADKMKFQFDKSEVMIQYGVCSKLNKPVTFIPNTCQVDMQNCFEHRRDQIL